MLPLHFALTVLLASLFPLPSILYNTMQRPISRQLTYAMLATMVIAYAPHAGAVFPDAAERVFDTRIQMVDNIPEGIAWLDNDNVGVTTFGDNDTTRWWIRKVVVIDTKVQKSVREMSPAFLLCSNPAKNVLSIAKGTLETMYTSNASAPAPLPTWFSWDQRGSVLKEISPGPAGQWNHFLCLRTSPEDVDKSPLLLYKESSIRYLQTEHGVLRWKYSPADYTAPVFLANPNKQEKPLDVHKGDLALEIQYLPFSNSYLLKPGWFALGGVTRASPGTNEMVDETPMVTLDPDSGKVRKSYVLPILKDHLPQQAEGMTLPIARGTLIYVKADQDRGGGLYVANKNVIKRVWCIDRPSPIPGKKFQNRCQIFGASIAISPDGCKAAFFSDFSSKGFDVYEKTAKILDLCATP